MSFWGNKKEQAQDPDSMGNKGRFATPPPCPRCELTKSQMNRTVQNYQKAYRKKVEGLKTELLSTRADNTQLRTQVRRLRRSKLVSAPSAAVGLVAGVLVADRVKALLQRLRDAVAARRQNRGGSGSGEAGGGQAAEAATEAAAAGPDSGDS